MKTRKVRYVGRISERHTGQVLHARDVPDTRRNSRGGSQNKKYLSLTHTPLFQSWP